jgi:hypothetical protein
LLAATATKELAAASFGILHVWETGEKLPCVFERWIAVGFGIAAAYTVI